MSTSAMEAEQKVNDQVDPHAWQDWPVSEITDAPELLGACEEMDLITLGAVHEAFVEGDFSDDVAEGFKDAFSGLWAANPEFAVPSSDDQEPSNGKSEPVNWLARIQKARATMAKMEARYLLQKSEAASAKKEWEASVGALARVIDQSKSGQKELFDREELETHAEVAPEDDESWKAVTLESLGVKGRLLERLVEAEIATLGEWTEWHGLGVNRPRIQGVGNGAVEKIADLCEAFWARKRGEAGVM
jgi:hypothetical protein